MSEAPYPLPNVRRVITGHTADGKSTVIHDESKEPVFWFSGNRQGVYDIYRINEVPANNDQIKGQWVDIVADGPAGPAGLVSPNGATVRVLDLPPGTSSPMHRTESIDFGLVLRGSVVCEFDNGETTTLNQSDIIVQRGTIHQWKNVSDDWTRLYFVVIGAKPVEVNGQVLGEDWSRAATHFDASSE